MNMKKRIEKLEKETGVLEPKEELSEALRELIGSIIKSDPGKQYTPEELSELLTNQGEGLKVWQR